MASSTIDAQFGSTNSVNLPHVENIPDRVTFGCGPPTAMTDEACRSSTRATPPSSKLIGWYSQMRIFHTSKRIGWPLSARLIVCSSTRSGTDGVGSAAIQPLDVR